MAISEGYRRIKPPGCIERQQFGGTASGPFGRGPADARGLHYVHGYLWPDRAQMVAASGMEGHAGAETAGAVFTPMPWYESAPSGQRLTQPKLGELHFMLGECSVSYVAHEVAHVVQHYSRVLYVISRELNRAVTVSEGSHWQLAGEEWLHGEADEELAYLQGDLTREVYAWLWELNRRLASA